MATTTRPRLQADDAAPARGSLEDPAFQAFTLLRIGFTVVTASAAIPAVFPSVRIDGRDLIDGGVADNAAVSQAVALGADTVYVLPTGFACALAESPRNPLASALHALTLLIEQRLIRVIPPLCPLSVPSTDFRYGELLITQARVASERWLDEGGPARPHPERFLSLHRHAIDTGAGPSRERAA